MSAKERPIIMTGASVRAIMAGTKTQTRRLIDMRKIEAAVLPWITRATVQPFEGPGLWVVFDNPALSSFVRRIRLRHQIGDRLWVKETFRQGSGGDSAHYRADPDEVSGGPWRPSIYMPRWASRLTLEITEVRVQRLQGMSEGDALAEGVEREDLPSDPDNFHPPGSYGFVMPGGRGKALIHVSPQGAFAEAWYGINGKRATWDSNPWVWAIGFQRAPKKALALPSKP